LSFFRQAALPLSFGLRKRFFSLIQGVSVFVLGGYFPQDAAGHTHGDHIVGNGFCHDAARADYGIVPDRDARKHGGACTNPHVVAYFDRFCDFKARLALLGVDGVFGGGEAAIGGDEYVVAESHLRSVRYDEIVIGIKIIAYGNVIPVIAPKRRRDDDVLPRFAENFFQKLLPRVVFGRT